MLCLYKIFIELTFGFLASHPAAEVHLQCGSKEQLGVPSFSIIPTPVSTPYDYGWSRLVFNNPPNPTAAFENNRIFTSTATITTTPQPVTHSNSSKHRAF